MGFVLTKLLYSIYSVMPSCFLCRPQLSHREKGLQCTLFTGASPRTTQNINSISAGFCYIDYSMCAVVYLSMNDLAMLNTL